MNSDNVWPEERPQKPGQPGGCLRGCVIFGIVVTLAGLVVLGLVGYFGWKFINEGISKDPKTLAEWKAEIVSAEIPAGYETKMGLRFWPATLLYIAPVDQKLGENGDEDFTQFILFSLPGMDFDALRDAYEQQRRRRNGNRKQEELAEEKFEFIVGDSPRRGMKRSWKDNQEEWVEYDVLLQPGVLFVAIGPAAKFDKEAMDQFLASVKPSSIDDELPGEMPEAPLEAKEESKPPVVEPAEASDSTGP